MFPQRPAGKGGGGGGRGGGWGGRGGGGWGGRGGGGWGGRGGWGWDGGWGWGGWWPSYAIYGLPYAGLDLADIIEQLNVTCAQWRTLSPNARLERVATVLVSNGTPTIIQPTLVRYLALSASSRQTVDAVVALLNTQCDRQNAPGGQLAVGSPTPTAVKVVTTAATVTVGMIIGALGMHSWLKKKY